MTWRQLFAGRTGGLDDIHQRLRDMLDINRHTLTLGISGLLGTTDPTTLPDRARRSDDRVDDLAHQVRRELVVHAAVRGTHTDLPAMLAAMSVVKDIQRIGDHASGLARLARIHGHFTPHQPQHPQLAAYRTRLDAHLAAARDALRTHDPTVAAKLITETIALTDEIDLAIDLLLVTGYDATDGTATALTYRHLSRIAAHLTNVATSVVLPVDQLDHHDGRDNQRTEHADTAT
jgi:phosphate uptake regulator